MNKNCKIFKDFIDFTNLMLYLLDSLFPLLYHCFVVHYLIIQNEQFLPTPKKNKNQKVTKKVLPS